jgi:glycosyltransferase involved in cell wall biosynthesis
MTPLQQDITNDDLFLSSMTRSVDWQSRPFSKENFGPVALVSMTPPIIMGGMAYENWIGMAGAFGRRFGKRPAAFLIYPTWTLEKPEVVSAIARVRREHCRRYPDHRLIHLANTQREVEMLEGEGVPTVLLNKNFTISERIFRPLEEVEPEFDAIHNARFVPEKRHELTRLIGSLAYMGYLEGTPEERSAQRALLEKLFRETPHHRLLNRVENDLPVRMSPADTNRTINLARVGLCLSAAEGNNNASMEYMLAGLGVVSTPSLGGRDIYFDKEYCIVCDPSPTAVRDAVTELIARQVPRSYIREQTLIRINKARERFLDLIDDLREQMGDTRKSVCGWPYGETSGMVTWGRFAVHLQKLEQGNEVARQWARDTVMGLIAEANSMDVQLKPEELFPIIRAILEIPDCRLLIFGCGNDSRLWELVNEGSTTVILEDKQEWIEKIHPRLFEATIHHVDYGPRVGDSSGMLDVDEDLLLPLPDSVRLRSWDIVIVNGPAGYDAELPRCARSIFTASRLVAPGGTVFVHDCDRPLQLAIADRYLGAERRFLSVTGRAQLDAYAF